VSPTDLRVYGGFVQNMRRKSISRFDDLLPFFRAWLRDPFRVAAVAPSSRWLAAVMTAEITPAVAPIIEFGPGSGVFTRALLARGVPEEQLTLIESSGEFATLVSARFPAARVLRIDASSLRRLELFDQQRAGAVISGLPLLSMPPKKLIAILKGAFHHLRPDGALYQFTYGPTCPIPRRLLDRLGLKATRIGGTCANFPPAMVYCIRRRAIHDRPEASAAFGLRVAQAGEVDGVTC
jgi:phosphatidylethanolamine/phosphatidyl-N-methylethanolamine N-methyltransferase